jgi:hypothetical protein
MTEPTSFFGRLKAKRKARVEARLAKAYKRGYEHAAGRLLSEGMACADDLCMRAETSQTFQESPAAKQFDQGVVSAVRDFSILSQKK